MPVWEWWRNALDPIRESCPAYCLQFWEVVGVWLAGIATFAAVIVSLWLARRDRIRLKVSAGVRLVVGPGMTEPFPEHLVVNVRNIGTRPATVDSVVWQRTLLLGRRRFALQTFYAPRGDMGPPARIEPSEAKAFHLRIDDPKFPWGDDIIEHFLRPWPRLLVRVFRVAVYTPSGEKFSSPVEDNLREWLLKRAAVEKKATS